MNRLRLPWLARLILLVAVGLQGHHLFVDGIEPWLYKVAARRWDTAQERSAVFSLGEEAAAYIRYVNRVTPESAAILLPDKRSGAPFTFTNRWWMQYFFFPRHVEECNLPTSDPCASRLRDPDYVVLTLGQFPPVDRLGQNMHLSVFPGEGTYEGVFAVEEFEAPSIAPAQMSRADRIREASLTGLILLIIVSVGVLAVSSMGNFDLLDLLALGFPIGLGLLTYLAFLLSWLGIPLSSPVYLGLLLFSLVAAGTAFVLSGGSGRLHMQLRSVEIGLAPRGLPSILLGLIGLGLVLLLAALSVGKSYTLTDPIQSWAQKGYAISHFQTIFAAEQWGTLGLSYPINVPLAISFFHGLTGDVGPGSKTTFTMFGASVLLILLASWRSRGLGFADGLLGALFLGTVPVFAFHMTRGMANMAFTAYFVGGGLLLMRALRGHDNRLALLAGILFGFGAWTRVEGLPFALILGIGLHLSLIRRDPRGTLAFWWLGPLLLLAGPWWLFSSSYVTGTYVGGAPSTFLSSLLEGDLNLGAWVTIPNAFGSHLFAWQPVSRAWGAFFAAGAGLLILGLFLSLGRKRELDRLDGLAWIVTLVCTAGIFYVWSFGRADFAALIDRSFDRALLPAASLFTAFLVPFIARSAKLRSSDSGATESEAPHPGESL